MPLLHYGGQTFELAAKFDVEDMITTMERMRGTSSAESGFARLPLADGGLIAVILSTSIPFAFTLDADENRPRA